MSIYYSINMSVSDLKPGVIKECQICRSKKIYEINNKEELDYLLKTIKDKKNFIIQEYVGSINEEYTSAVYSNGDISEVITFKRKLTGGMTSFAEIVEEEVLVDYCKLIAKSFNLKGSINIQSRKVGNKFFIFEINPRLSSTIFIRDNYGFNDLMWWIKDITLSKNNLYKIDIKTKGKAILGYKYNFIE